MLIVFQTLIQWNDTSYASQDSANVETLSFLGNYAGVESLCH